MPGKIVMIIEKMMRDFLWEGSGEAKKDHLINWEIVSRTKVKGGIQWKFEGKECSLS